MDHNLNTTIDHYTPTTPLPCKLHPQPLFKPCYHLQVTSYFHHLLHIHTLVHRERKSCLHAENFQQPHPNFNLIFRSLPLFFSQSSLQVSCKVFFPLQCSTIACMIWSSFDMIFIPYLQLVQLSFDTKTLHSSSFFFIYLELVVNSKSPPTLPYISC